MTRVRSPNKVGKALKPQVHSLPKQRGRKWRCAGGRAMVAVNEKRNNHPHQRGWE
jgi:hypothetical protein